MQFVVRCYLQGDLHKDVITRGLLTRGLHQLNPQIAAAVETSAPAAMNIVTKTAAVAAAHVALLLPLPPVRLVPSALVHAR